MVRVLIADDEKLTLNGMAGIVKKLEGFDVAALAENGEEALRLIEKEKPDLLITDIRMPRIDGMELIAEIERRKICLPTIIISAYDDEEYIKKAIRSGSVFDYLFKPFLPKDLEESLMAVSAFAFTGEKETDNKDLDHDLIRKAVKGRDYEALKEDLDAYFENSHEKIGDLKNRVYGWIMFIHYDLMASSGVVPLTMRNAMKDVYDALDKEGIKEAVSSYLKDSCERYVEEEQITAIVSASLQIVKRELANPDLNVGYCADKLKVTPNYLSNRFSRDMHRSFSSYLNDLRMEKAKELLGNLNLKVYEVSQDVGYYDVAYFNRVFKDHFGLTPVQFRFNMFHDNKDEDQYL